MTQINVPIVNAGYLSVQDLELNWVSNTTLTMEAGQARDQTNVNDIILAAQVTINGANKGVNGLDTGVLVLSTLYAIYVIGDSSQNLPACGILSANQSVPVLPAGYDMSRLIGYIATDASVHFLPGYWFGCSNTRSFTYDSTQATAITAGNATTYTAVALTKFVPAVNNTPVNVAYSFTPATAGNALNLQALNQTGSVPALGQVAAVVTSGVIPVLAQLTGGLLPEINYKVANASDAVAVNVAGYWYCI